MPQPRVTLKIPKPLFDHISKLIEGSGFSSVTDFVVFVLRDIVYEGRLPAGAPARPTDLPEFSGEQLERIKRKLKELGYL